MSYSLRAQSALLGALIADAAALGCHWIYDPARIREIAQPHPEFLVPQAAHYAGVGYFAHGGKQPGAPTHYGEQLLVAMRSMARCHGEWHTWDYLQEFQDTFERGGSWHGYMDHATKETLDNLQRAQTAWQEAANSAAPSLSAADKRLIDAPLQEHRRTARGEALCDAILADIRTKSGALENPDDARMYIRGYDNARNTAIGANDKQLPAFSKLPPIVARYAGDPSLPDRVEEAILATNNNETALAYASYGAAVLEQVLLGAAIRDALETSLSKTSGDTRARLQKALTFEDTDPAAISKEFGAACNTDMAFPVAVAILKDVTSAIDGIRANLFAGGDNAGRGIFVGAVLVAAHAGTDNGLPLSWQSRLDNLQGILNMTETIVSANPHVHVG